MKKEEPKLKPCPFCGGSGNSSLLVDKVLLGDWFGVRCLCGVDGAVKKRKRDAIAAWNKRAKP